MAQIVINHVVSGSVTVDGTITGIIKSGGGSANIQENKNATASTTAVEVTPDTGYDAMAKVTIAGVPLQAKNVTPSAVQQVIEPDSNYLGLSSVTVGAVPAGGDDTLSKLMCSNAERTATVDGSKSDTAYFRGIAKCYTLVLKNLSGMAASCCKDWLIHNVDIQCQTIGTSAFENCPLETIILRNATSIGKQAFYSQNGSITNIYIYTPTMCTVGRNAFSNTMTATIHVPAALLSEYQANSSWAAYASVTWVGDL